MNYYSEYLQDKYWLIEQEGWNPHFQAVSESQFALGNGYIGSRGIYEEIPYDAYAGTYIAGVYDKAPAQVPELVNLPNPIDFRITIEGEKLGLGAMDVLEHRRVLNMKEGLLIRQTQFSNSKKSRFDYQSLRFFSMRDNHIGLMQIYFTPLDTQAAITIQSTINYSITNRGVLTEGRKRHFQIVEVGSHRRANYLTVETFESKILIGYASCLFVSQRNRQFSPKAISFSLKLKKGETVCFTKIFSIYTSREISKRQLKSCSIKALQDSVGLGFKRLLKRHISHWAFQWRNADIEILPDRDIQRALRFNIYHMLISANQFDLDAGIGARTLTGEGYRGHIFWDNEIFFLPFFIYTNPAIARNMLYYRYRRLDKALENAKNKGYLGALFPWESADSGNETTPSWHKHLDGRIIQIHTGQREHHIAGDIAYAVYHYYQATNDSDFMFRAGLEMIFQTARFWASRAEFNKRNDIYEIKHVIGPDEFHEDVDNNAYTNFLAKWNLLKASQLYRQINRAATVGKFNRGQTTLFKKLKQRLKLNDKEIRQWERIGKNLFIPCSKAGITEQFSGYFDRRFVPIKELDKHFMPLIPRGISLRKIGNTQLIKQADVLMLMYLFSDFFPLKQRRDNFVYYEKRTLHKSSLSPAVSSIVGCQTGRYSKALHYFLFNLYADLKDLHGNTRDGIHAAALGGSWQIIIAGFCGISIKNDVLSLNPKLPQQFNMIKFRIKYRDFHIAISVFADRLQLVSSSFDKKKTHLLLRVYNRLRELENNKRYLFKKGG